MDIPRLPSAGVGAATPVGRAPQATATQAFKKWSAGYQADHQQLQQRLENVHSMHKMDNVQLLQLQAVTQRFSLQTELAARMADRVQNATRQLLSQGG